MLGNRGVLIKAALVIVGAQAQAHRHINDGGYAYLLGELDKRRIGRVGQCFLQRHGGLIGASVFHAVAVRRAAGGAAVTKTFRLVAGGHIHGVFDAIARFERGRGGKDLEDGTCTVAHQGIGLRQDGFILVQVQAIVTGGDHGQHLAIRCAGFDDVHDFRHAWGVRVGVALHGLKGLILHRWIQRGLDGVATAGQLFLANALLIQVLQHIITVETAVTRADAAIG